MGIVVNEYTEKNVLLVSMIALLAITGNIISKDNEELKTVTASKDLIEQVEKSEKPVAVSTEKQESLVTEPTRAVTKKSTLPMTTKLLPAENSEVRIKETSHIVLHFSSNASAKPQDPYNVNDVYQIFKDHGVSSHYMIDRAGKIYQLTD